MIKKWERVIKIHEGGNCDTTCPYFESIYEVDFGQWSECQLGNNSEDSEYCPLYDNVFDFDTTLQEELDRADESYIKAIEQSDLEED